MKFAAAVCLFSFPTLLYAFTLPARSYDARYEKRASKPIVDWVMPAESNEIKVMTYNVENLFDTNHDEGKQDYEFLPVTHPLKSECATLGKYRKPCEETDWTPEKMMMKISQIHRLVQAQGESAHRELAHRVGGHDRVRYDPEQ